MTGILLFAGVIARARRRRRRRRLGAVAVLAAAGAAAAALTPLLAGHRPELGGGHSGRPAVTAAERRLASGRDVETFSLREPAGVILTARVTARRGVSVDVDATIPGLAGVFFGTATRFDRAPSCRLHGALKTCTQPVEWCPMPRATWHFRVVKTAGPPGEVRVDFVVGPKPGATSAVD